MGQAGEKREESARGEGGLGLRAAAEAWGMGPLTALHYTAVLRSVELCSAVLFTIFHHVAGCRDFEFEFEWCFCFLQLYTPHAPGPRNKANIVILNT